MTRYLISFDDAAMTFPEEDLADVAAASHAVVEQAKQAGVWVTGGGIDGRDLSVVGTDGSATHGTTPPDERYLSGFSILDVASHEDALEWAARIAASCRCAQQVRPLQPDPDV